MGSNISTEDSNSRTSAINGDKTGTQSASPFSGPAFQALVNDAPYPIVRYDTDRRRVFVNPTFTQIVGMPAESLLNKTPTEQPISPDAAELERKLREALNTGRFDEHEFKIEDQHGASITFLVRIIPVRQHGKEISGVMCVGHDISMLKQADQELRILKTALNNSSDAVFLVNDKFDFAYVNDTACKKLGYSREELTTMSPVDIDPSVPDKAHLQGLVASLMKTDFPPIETQHQALDGHTFPVEIATCGIEVDGKNFGLSICRDVSERKKAERELLILQTALNRSTDAIFLGNSARQFIYVNDAACRRYGYSREEFALMTPVDIDPDLDDEELRKITDKANDAGDYPPFERRHQIRSGRIFPVEISLTVIFLDGERYALTICRDITDRKQMQSALQESRDFFNGIFSSIPNPVFVKDHQGRWTHANNALCEFADRPAEDILGKSDFDLFPESEALTCQVGDEFVFSSGKTLISEETLTDDKGAQHHIQIQKSRLDVSNGEPYLIGVISDFTARKQAEDAMRDSEKRHRSSSELLHSVLESSPDVMVFALDRNYRYISFNTRHKKTMRTIWGKEIALGMSMLEAISSDEDRVAAKRGFDRALAGESFVTQEAYGDERLSRKYWQISWSPIRTESGEIVGLTCFNLNISEQRRMEESLQERDQNLREVARIARIGSWELDLKTGTSIWTEELFRILELDPEVTEPSFQAVLQHVHPQDLEQALSFHASSTNNPSPYQLEHRLQFADGRIKYLHVRCEPAQNGAGETTHLRGAVQDITERKLAEIALAENERHLSNLINFSPDAILAIDESKQVTVWNHAIEKMTGIQASEMLGKGSYAYMAPFYGYARPHLVDLFWNPEHQISEEYSSLEWEGESVVGEVFCPALNEGKGMYIWAKASPLRDTEGRLIGAIECIRDITERKRHEGELEYVANHDTMTGLPNRRLLADRIDQAVLRAKRSGKSLAVCYLDIDNFKPINDRYGHATGDQILIAASKRIKQIMRAEDTLARLGGDEFVLLFNDISNAEEISSILERLQIAVHEPLEVDGLTVNLSASIGVTLYPEDNAEAELLLRHADQAMYRAKQTGKNRFLLFDPDREQEAQKNRKKTQRLQKALESEELVLHYQPKVDLHNSDIVGFEALIRWQHPEKGLLYPSDFLHYMQGNDLEIEFGEWVINSVLKQIEAWQERGHAFTISANISPGHLLSANFSEQLQKKLDKHPNVAPDLLELEILETAALSDMQNAVTTLHRCQELGVKISLDDFGTGHSSLTYLRNLPVDILKIDRSFISNMLTDESDHSIVLSVVQLAHTFKRQVIAEGVESIEQGAMLYQLGCPIAQGYGIAKPMPVERIPVWIEQWQENTEWRALGSATSVSIPL